MHEIDAVPKLAKTTKHTIEVVVDRLKVRAEFKQRLAESYETALRHGDGRAIAVEMDNENERTREHLFSAEVRVPDLQLFAGRARAAAVLVQQPARRVPALRRSGLDQLLRSQARRRVSAASLASGAIKGWDRRNQFYFQMLQGLAKHVGFDVDRPFAKLPERVQNARPLRLGRREDPVHVPVRARPAAACASTRSRASFRTSSAATARPTRVMVREELAKYLNSKPCPECGGTRLRREARHVEGRRRRATRARSSKCPRWPLKADVGASSPS